MSSEMQVLESLTSDWRIISFVKAHPGYPIKGLCESLREDKIRTENEKKIKQSLSLPQYDWKKIIKKISKLNALSNYRLNSISRSWFQNLAYSQYPSESYAFMYNNLRQIAKLESLDPRNYFLHKNKELIITLHLLQYPFEKKQKEMQEKITVERNERLKWKVRPTRGALGNMSWKKVRLVFHKTKNRCFYCGVKFQKNVNKYRATIDHFIPISKKGTNYSSNLFPCCFSCNSRKGQKIGNDYLDFLVKEREQNILEGIEWLG